MAEFQEAALGNLHIHHIFCGYRRLNISVEPIEKNFGTVLDGGRFVMLVIEAIIRRPLPRKFEYIINGVGLALLLIFIAVISVKDVWQLVTGTFPSM